MQRLLKTKRTLVLCEIQPRNAGEVLGLVERLGYRALHVEGANYIFIPR